MDGADLQKHKVSFCRMLGNLRLQGCSVRVVIRQKATQYMDVHSYALSQGKVSDRRMLALLNPLYWSCSF